MNTLFALLSGYWTEQEIAANLIILFNLIGALALGLIVGYERSYRGRAAGMRTYGFVCMASCALTIVAGFPTEWYGGHLAVASDDPGRIIQGIVTGIGFLGAGVIMRDGMNISGLTTAASIWTVAVIGVLVGVGFYGAAISLTVLSGIFMVWGAKIEAFFPARHAVSVSVRFKKDMVPTEENMLKMGEKLGYEIAGGSFTITKRDGHHEWRLVAVSKGKGQSGNLVQVSTYLAADETIESYQILYARN